MPRILNEPRVEYRHRPDAAEIHNGAAMRRKDNPRHQAAESSRR
jgi:hypothetical protein